MVEKRKGRNDEDQNDIGEENALWKHAKEYHESRKNIDYRMVVNKTYRFDNMTRQVNESVRIDYAKCRTLNSKRDYNRPQVPTLSMHRRSTAGI